MPYEITIIPVIHREDGKHTFEDTFEIGDVFSVVALDDGFKLCSKCDGVSFWSSSTETKKVTTSSGRVYETQDHWKKLHAGSDVVLEPTSTGLYYFKFKRTTRFNIETEFNASLVRR